jgi:RNA polymerase sigma-70 factor (ECF subfamily)
MPLSTVGGRVRVVAGAGDPSSVSLVVPESFDEFYRRSYRGLVALSAGLIGDRDSAEDVVQDALYAAYRDWQRVGVLESPIGWVRRIVANKSVSFIRRRLVEGRALTRSLGRRPPAEDMPEAGIDFWRLVRRLPSRQAQVVALFYAEDLSVAEIGRTLGVAEGSVKASLSKARATLAKHLEDN